MRFNIDRAQNGIQAMLRLADNASSIAYTCRDTDGNSCVVAVIGPDLTYHGTQSVTLAGLADHINGLAEGCWSVVFCSRATEAEIQERCRNLGHATATRLRAMQHWNLRHAV